MPIAEAGFYKDGKPDENSLIVYGPTLTVVVGHHDTENSALKDKEKSETVLGLIDTGATESCIDNQLAISLGLPVIDVREISGVGGSSQHSVYMAHLFIPSLGMNQYGAFTGVKLTDGGQEHRVLLGRTYLRRAIMIYDGYRSQITIATANEK